MDLQGRLVALHSEKNAPLAKTIKFIEKQGTPLIVCTDVSPPPKLVQDVAIKFGAKLVDFGLDVRLGDKYKMVRERKLFVKVDNRHELDALAAAIKAHKLFSSKLRQVEKHLREEDLEAEGAGERVIREVLAGERMKIAISREKEKAR